MFRNEKPPMKILCISLLMLTLLLPFSDKTNAAETPVEEIVPGIPVKNTVTMVDLGATTCIPCKMMAPILEDLKEVYKGRAAIIFIDVWDKANSGKAQSFKIMAIPTQIFYDKKGKEVFRHTGFFDKESIVAKLEELLEK